MIICPHCSLQHAFRDAACPNCGFFPASKDGFPAWAPEMATVGGGFHETFFSELATSEAGNFWFEARNAIVARMLKRFFPQFRSFLEIGCGTGFVLSGVARAFPDVRLVGTEIFTAALGFAAARVPSASFAQMDARRLPYAAEFDVVGAFDVIEHINEDVEVLANLKHAVKPGGGVIITVPQHKWLWSELDEYSFHSRRYEMRELHKKIEGAGLDIVYSTSFVSLLLPLMFLSRRRNSAGQRFDAGRELRIGSAANASLRAVMGLESLILATGVTLPAGGSRLVVARRP
ncbi:class I SAM-dependent methyltransferase [Mesorhizobium sp. B2-5-13]|uniref:class I SAM-dependent methyltransferase n=1 Tax=unclassified Mesorhizobium TaxID=325217 RepID=UPI00112E7EFB|nr:MULTISPECIES: class I SAM-dependent methyltransferase [unclassified Mesorhizobium]TPJ75494.1 class I SAM-dependent methyltransferase [Mesorhizobium sp. B2-5-13]TPK41436.1 class I SAM-dependent methyltransferase [Mesorhizobium sp. B2-5-5]